MITQTAHVGIYVVKSPDGLQHKNKLIAELYTGRKIQQGDCLEDMTLPNSLRCATYLDFGRTVLSRVPYALIRKDFLRTVLDKEPHTSTGDSDDKKQPLLVVFHPGLKLDRLGAEPVSRAQLDRIAQGALKSFEESFYQLAFRTDETPIRLEWLFNFINSLCKSLMMR